MRRLAYHEVAHGTYAGAVWHAKWGFPTCEACKEARREYQRQRRQRSDVHLADVNQLRAYRRALVRLREAHRDDFDRLYAEERGCA